MADKQCGADASGMSCLRAATLPEEYIPELKEAAESIGLNWADFKITDNTCKPHPPAAKRPTKVPCRLFSGASQRLRDHCKRTVSVHKLTCLHCCSAYLVLDTAP